MQLSIIIPTLNEAKHIERCISRLRSGNNIAEIIVVDAGSTDDTAGLARDAGAIVFSVPKKCRASQMNFGAAKATGDLLYFVHGDVLPPEDYATHIAAALADHFPLGRFRFRFDSTKLMLRINSWFTRFDRLWVSGGDETLFITKELFQQVGGYDESFVIMEEYDMVLRARKHAPYKVIQRDVLVSARKYEHNSWLRVQRANLSAFRMFKAGIAPAEIRQAYHRMIHHPKDIS